MGPGISGKPEPDQVIPKSHAMIGADDFKGCFHLPRPYYSRLAKDMALGDVVGEAGWDLFRRVKYQAIF